MSAPTGQPVPAPSAQTAKIALRSATLAARRRNAPDPFGDTARTEALLAIPEIAAAKVVAGYLALPGEPDIGAPLQHLRERGVQVILPVVTAARDVDFRVWAGPLVHGFLGVAVPPVDSLVVPIAAADVVLAPAVAADRAGHRLGRGGGFYDRALSRVRPEALVIAVIHTCELVKEVPTEAHDVTVGAVLAGAQLFRVAP